MDLEDTQLPKSSDSGLLRIRTVEKTDQSADSYAIFARTFGCGHNQSDGEYMCGLLANAGFKLVSSMQAAHIVLVNGCTVKGPSQDHFYNLTRTSLHAGKQVILAGCVLQGDRGRLPPEFVPFYEQGRIHIIGVEQLDKVVESAAELAQSVADLSGCDVAAAGSHGGLSRLEHKTLREGLPSLSMPKVRRNPRIEIIPVCVGCLGHCAYCKTRFARGRLRSYTVAAVLERVREVVKEPEATVREIWLTGEDTAAYGKDIGTDLPSLIRAVAEAVPDYMMIRVGMGNPDFSIPDKERLAEAMRHPRVFKFLHLPVQAGSDHTLELMKRNYTVEGFMEMVHYLMLEIPGITISTDIICGFPGETKEDFAGTVRILNEIHFPILNISKFFVRPGTPAAKEKQINNKVIKARSRECSNIYASYRTYDDLVGKDMLVYFNEVANDGVTLAGRTETYVQVLVQEDLELLGTAHNCFITQATKHYVRGTLVQPKN